MVIVHGKRRREKALAQQNRFTLYILNFIFAMHLALVSYFMSPFLIDRGFPKEFIGLLYSAGSIITLLAIAYAPHLLSKYGNYTNMLVLGLLESLAFIGLAYTTSLPVLFILFMTIFVVPALIAFSLDIFLEGATRTEGSTGGIRGIFLTVASIAWVAAPIIGGFVVGNGNYAFLFIAAALVFSPFIFIAAARLDDFKDPKYVQLDVAKFMLSLRTNADLRSVFAAQFLLRFFYGIMTIYLPLYVHTVLGMPLSSIGLIIGIGTLAFVLLEIPLGKLQDTLWGEKEVLVLGFLVISTTTGIISFLNAPSLLLIIAIIFATRIGAAMIEMGSEGYFFKHVEADDADDVSAFRMLFPLAYIISPLFGTVMLFFLPLPFIFLGTAILLLSGVLFAAELRDTN
tara:strand:- start:12648 stop:13844 length:1197 start_codon:yes stop_codon:yes gene_type:complete